MILDLRALFKKEVSAEGCGHCPCAVSSLNNLSQISRGPYMGKWDSFVQGAGDG